MTVGFSFSLDFHFFCKVLSLFISLCSLSLKLAASSNFCSITTEFFLFLILSISISKSIIFCGTLIFKMCALEPASSKTSMALSGKNLSVIYLSAKYTHARIASSE